MGPAGRAVRVATIVAGLGETSLGYLRGKLDGAPDYR
jgi:hypothetical protein